MEEVATTAKGCEECNSEKSAQAWKIRSGDVWEYETDEHSGANKDKDEEEVDENAPSENNCWGFCLESKSADGDGKAKAKAGTQAKAKAGAQAKAKAGAQAKAKAKAKAK